MKKNKLGISVLSVGILIASASLFFIFTQDSSRSTELNDSKISLEASYVTYETVSALDSGAELIVIGTPLRDFDDRKHIVTTFDDGALQDFYTLTDIQVDEVIKAPKDSTLAADEALTIIEPISYIEGAEGKRKITFEDYTELKQNEKSIIFLKQNSQGEYSVINMDLGKFSLESTSQFLGTSKTQDSKEKFRQSVLEKYNL
ncbi:hypothetical protein [Paenibacillus sp. FSL L8-0494]|uniref:hypothetical protein n=1 Tax=Paenibacillus sp. FSL L8-0494 TaxID=2975352 RepID=UPI0030F7D626